MANALSRAFNKLVRKQTPAPVEGEFRQGPYYLPVTGAWLGAYEGQFQNWWQLGYNALPTGARSAIVEACVSAYSQTMAMCPGDHWRSTSKGGRERVKNSALSRILRQPNDYMSMSDFLLNAVRNLYMDGNAYALCVRNDRYEISELHLMTPHLCWPQLDPDGGIWYNLGGNWIIQNRLKEYGGLYPARDVLHIKLHTSLQTGQILIGQSPITSASIDIATGDAIKAQQLAFFSNQARPSFVLSTDLLMDKDQTQALRDRWNEQTRGVNAGGTPILTGGLKPQLMTMRSRDAQLAEMLKMTDQDIALAFRVPLALLGIGGAPHGSTEALMQEWIASGLGFCLNHVEESFGQTFRLRGVPEEYVEFDTAALLRSAFKDRIAALKDGVMGGIFAPNEARNLEGLDSVKFGDEPRLQQQVVPLSAAAGIPVGGPGTKTPIAASPPAPPAPAQPGVQPKPKEQGPPKRSMSDANRRNVVKQLLASADRFDRAERTAAG